MFFSPLGPSLNSRNLTLNRATGVNDERSGCSEGCRVGRTLDGSLECKDCLWIAVVAMKLIFLRY